MATKQSRDDWQPPLAHYQLLESYESTLSDHQLLLLSKQLQTALRRFEALAGRTIYVGRMPPDRDNIGDAHANAHYWNHLVQFQPGETPSNMVLYHELAHLAIHQLQEQGEAVPPSSEEFCSLYALTKMSPSDIFATRVPYFGEPAASRDQWSEIAEAALEYREERGYNSHYVQYARDLFEGGLDVE